MHIAVDARKIADFGIGTYIRNLLSFLPRVEPELKLELLGDPSQASLLGATTRPYTWTRNISPGYGLAELLTISRQLRQLKPQVFHSPHYVLPLGIPCATVVTIHDCIHLHFPEQLPNRLALRYARYMLRKAVRDAQRIIVVSNATRTDLIEMVDADPARIEVIPNGCDPFFFKPPGERVATIRERLNLAEPFLLYVGNAKPHKNLGRLIQAFAHLVHEQNAGAQLAIVGAAATDYPGIASYLLDPEVLGRLRFCGFVDAADLRALYHAARALVCPSLYEGFGLPPLEAMACGTPTLVSNAGGLPEVVGDAGMIVDPLDVDALSKGMAHLLEDNAHCTELSKLGRIRARSFCWEETARRTLTIYRELVG